MKKWVQENIDKNKRLTKLTIEVLEELADKYDERELNNNSIAVNTVLARKLSEKLSKLEASPENASIIKEIELEIASCEYSIG